MAEVLSVDLETAAAKRRAAEDAKSRAADEADAKLLAEARAKAEAQRAAAEAKIRAADAKLHTERMASFAAQIGEWLIENDCRNPHYMPDADLAEITRKAGF